MITSFVVAAHALVLGDMPTGASLLSDNLPDPQPLSLSVVTRNNVTAKIAVVQKWAPPPSVNARKAIPTIAAQLSKNSNATEALASYTQPTTVMEVPAVTPVALPDVPLALGTNIAPTVVEVSEPKQAVIPVAVSVSDVPRMPKVAYSPSALLIYDLRGEERGYIKYAGSGELLWTPDRSRYNAHLEISAWGFRVRTWSSEGNLTDEGLQPLRFGDKPRGAELATHFRREKGIISFSANNPDVTLQTGAQDKLSAILQLSALVAGEPERYDSGGIIAFQAADAHRAELWNFKVGLIESLGLPGGMVTALKLSKEPTPEFDQRIEVWLASDLHYMPVRIRITEANGAIADLLWRKTQKPD